MARGLGASHRMDVVLVSIGMTTPCMKPVAWPRGAGMSILSPGPMPRDWAKADSEAMRLLWVSMTPLACASEPEVNRTAATSSPEDRTHRDRGSGGRDSSRRSILDLPPKRSS